MNSRRTENVKNKKSIVCFVILVIILSCIVDFLIAKGASDYLYPILMWMPALAALIASIVTLKENGEKITFRSVSGLCGFHKCKWRYIFMGMLVPLIYLAIPYAIYWIVFPGSLSTNATSVGGALIGVAIAIVLGNILSLLTALGEEIGWRGFWVPRMEEAFGVRNALAVTSIFWCLWHFPLIIFDDYMTGTPLWYNLLAFALCIFPVGVIAGILSLKSKSVWPSAMLHAAHNNYDQIILAPRTIGDNKMFFVSETGLLTILFAWIIAILMYIRFKADLSRENPANSDETDASSSIRP